MLAFDYSILILIAFAPFILALGFIAIILLIAAIDELIG